MKICPTCLQPISNRKKRSLEQNAWYWGVLLATIADSTGFTDDECHEIFKKKFLSYEKKYKGKIYKFTKSTASLNVSQMAEYLTKISVFAATDLGVIIPQQL